MRPPLARFRSRESPVKRDEDMESIPGSSHKGKREQTMESVQIHTPDGRLMDLSSNKAAAKSSASRVPHEGTTAKSKPSKKCKARRAPAMAVEGEDCPSAQLSEGRDRSSAQVSGGAACPSADVSQGVARKSDRPSTNMATSSTDGLSRQRLIGSVLESVECHRRRRQDVAAFSSAAVKRFAASRVRQLSCFEKTGILCHRELWTVVESV